MAPHSSTLAWKIPWTAEPGAAVPGVAVSWTRLSGFAFTFQFHHWRRRWQPTPVFLPGESQGRGSLGGCHLWGQTVRHDLSDLAAAADFIFDWSIKLLLSCSVVSDSLWPHRLQHSRIPCPSPSPGVCSNSCPLSQWCHPTISSSVTPFSSCPQSFPASRSFPMSWLFVSGGQSVGASASGSVFPMNIQDWLVWSPCSPRDSQESLSVPDFKIISSLVLSFLYGPTLTSIHDYLWNIQYHL